MNKKLPLHFLWGITLGLVGIATTDVYAKTDMNLLIHTHSAAEQSIPLRKIHQITFSNEAVNIKLKNENPISVLFNDLSHFGFEETTSAIEEISTNSAFSVAYHPANQCVVATAALPISSICVYNMQGHLIEQATPQATEVILPLDYAPKGIYIVVVSTEEETISQKIMKP